jgi:hypothetical protein
MVKVENYFETFAEAIDACQIVLDNANAVPVNSGPFCPLDELWPALIFALGPVSYGQTIRACIPLATVRGKQTRSVLQVNIYRLESGRYELNAYAA